MTALVALAIVIAVLLVLHACATSIADSHELHELAVRVHTVRNDYLANLRGEAVEVVEIVGSGEPEMQPEPEPAAQPADAEAPAEQPEMAQAA